MRRRGGVRVGRPAEVRGHPRQVRIEHRHLFALRLACGRRPWRLNHSKSPVTSAAPWRGVSKRRAVALARSPRSRPASCCAARRHLRQRRAPFSRRRLGAGGQRVEVRDHVGDFLVGQLGLGVRKHAAERIPDVGPEARVGDLAAGERGTEAALTVDAVAVRARRIAEGVMHLAGDRVADRGGWRLGRGPCARRVRDRQREKKDGDEESAHGSLPHW